ncbi:MAG: type I secretion C-terminal target domain-containing protein, partial [Sphingomonadales bacterium]
MRVSVGPATAQNTGHGNDTLAGIENLFGSSFDDELSGNSSANYLHGFDGGNDLLEGMGGDDVLEVQRSSSSGAAAITMLGGGGSDILRYTGNGASDSATLSGGGGSSDTIEATGLLNGTITTSSGNDRASIDTMVGQYVITMGSGGDVLALQSTGGGFRAVNAINLTDFDPAEGDRIDLSAWIAGGALQNYTRGNPFLTGHLQLAQAGPHTLLQVDRDGGSDNFVTLLTFQNVTATAFTAASLGGFPPHVEGQGPLD